MVTQLSHRRRMWRATHKDNSVNVAPLAGRLSDWVLSNCRVVHVFAPRRDVFPKQRMPAVNDRITQREIITAQTTRLARLDTRYTIVIQCYARRTQMNDSIGAQRDSVSVLVSLSLSLSLGKMCIVCTSTRRRGQLHPF